MDDDSGGDGQSRVQVVLKLEGGKLPNEGRVEVFYNGEWGTICDDNFGMTEADIICRELGFRGAAGTRANGYYGQGSGRIWIDELKCTGNEYNIMECTRNPWGTNDCSHAEDVGVICQTKNLIVAPVANVVTTTTLAPKVCGVPLFRANMGRIVGGSLAAKGSWPWQGSLRLLYSNGGSAHTCGATLVAPNWAVTAAHCFGQSRDPNGYKIRFGEHDQRYWERTEEDRRVSKLVMHSQYNVRPHANDIAMLKLDTPVNMASPYVNTACLPDANEVFDSHDTCFVTGWGSTQGTSYGFLLNQVNVPIISNFDCWRSYGSTILDSMLCAGYVQGGKDACQGDSGGPFVCIKNGRWKLAGIVSWGRDCGAVYSPGVYTRVSKYLNWINYIIQNE
ncbi:neurotrypsin-like [Lingula anatina]|uniref:Neurotrypsin-like n=1 Tax=Lingula anatina TaxID=7574 RepID=A0A1S3KCW5_LINAN|nr:neurotrypsin-like [Lingula anatina]|eukprot:XP_013420480.1 neurotrypsin-like [Lingula anatina]